MTDKLLFDIRLPKSDVENIKLALTLMAKRPDVDAAGMAHILTIINRIETQLQEQNESAETE